MSYRWERFDDAALLRLRFSDLGLRISGSPVHAEALRLGEQLERRGIRFKPHLWFSTDWFSPDGVPGIAVPFFLGHPRLLRLERRMLGEAEGSNRRWRLRILRHELGHAVDTAFALRRRRDWQQAFGRAAERYSRDYVARPGARITCCTSSTGTRRVIRPRTLPRRSPFGCNRKRAGGATMPAGRRSPSSNSSTGSWPSSPGRTPSKRNRSFIAPLTHNNRTLREHYRRRAYLSDGREQRYDSWLMRVFAPRGAAAASTLSAERWLSDIKPQLTRALLRRTGVHPYLAFQVLRGVRRRARSLDLMLRGAPRDAAQHLTRLHERVIADLLRRNEETYFL